MASSSRSPKAGTTRRARGSASTKGTRGKSPTAARPPAKRQRKTRGLPLLLVGLGVLAAAVAMAVWPDTPDPEVGPNATVNEGGPMSIVDARNSPGIVRNPTDPDNLVVVHRIDRPMFGAEVHASHDGGATWSVTEPPLPDELDRPFAPDAAFAPDGTLYVTYVNLVGQGNTPDNVWITRSDDGGRTLQDPRPVAGELSFQVRLAVGPAGELYVTYVDATDVALLQLVGDAPLVAVRSDDAGETWSEPVQVSAAARPGGGAATPAVDEDGDLVVLYQDFKDNVRDFQNLEGPPWEGPAALVLTRSSDGGETFQEGVEFESDMVPPGRFLVFLPEFPSLALADGGRMAAAWSDARQGEEDVFVRRSDDGGRTWTDAAAVSDAPAAERLLPTVALTPGGRVDVLYYERSAERAMDTMLAYSTDGGDSFRSLRVSSESFDPETGPDLAEHLGIDFGTRIGLVSDDQSATGVWTDSRLAEDPDHARQDIFAATVTLPDARAGARRLIAVGLLVMAPGCLLVAGVILRRRRPRTRRRR
ncbi:MAG: sialidase family protein [Egibacteraceae bacterium]